MIKICLHATGAAALLFLAACSDSPKPTVSEPVAQVTTTAATRGDLPIVVTGYGTVEFDPARQILLTTEIEARVTEILVQPGARTEPGASLIRLAPSSASALALARAQSDLARAESDLARQRRLRADGLASDSDVESARVAARDLAAQVETLSRNAGEIRDVRAPAGGVIDAIFVSPGDVVPAASQLLRISAPDAIQARISLELEDSARLSPGASVHLEGLDGGTHVADAGIAEVDLRVDPQTRMTSILVPVPPGEGFLPGEAVRASIVAEVRRDTLLVPRNAVFTDEQGDFVFVDTGGTAERRPIVSGATGGDLSEIVSGVSAGEMVVTEGGAVLSDGMKLDASVTKPAASGDAG